MNQLLERQTVELLTRAVARHQQGDLGQAEALYAQVLADAPNHPDALHLLGVIAQQRGQSLAAVQLIEQAIAVEPNRWAFHSNLACALESLGRRDEAIHGYRQAINLGGESAPLLSNLGAVCQDAGRRDEARHCYQRAISLDPRHAEAHYNLGNLAREMGDAAGAIVSYEQALRLRPTYVEAQVNLANLLLDEGRPEEAIRRYERALELNPRDAETHYNLARALKTVGRASEALTAYERAIEIKPDHAAAHMLRGLLLLRKGDLAQGWSEYDWRWRKKDELPMPSLPQPQWRGESLAGRTLFVFGEQGVGDEIMFASCLPDVISQAEHCVIECDARLTSLFRRSFPSATIRSRVAWGEHDWLSQVRPIDCQSPLGDLPRWLRPKIEDFPTTDHYLQVDPALVARWRDRVAALGPGFKIGISWRGASEHEQKYRRSIPLADWAPLLNWPGARFVNLQYGKVATEIAEVEKSLGVEIHDWEDADPERDLDSLAAQMAALDLVITIGNTNAHLAGALGLRVWTLLPQSPSWRWGEAGETTPWYRSMRLFRQSSAGDWKPLLMEVRQAVEAFSRGCKLAPAAQNAIPDEPLKRSRARITDCRWNLNEATVDEAFAQASRYHKAGEASHAEGILREILRLAPAHVASLHRLGILLRETGRRDEGLTLLRRAAKIASARPNILFDLAVVLSEANLQEEAERVLRRVIELDPNQGPAYVNLGVVCEKLGKIDDALSICQRGAQLLPESAQARYNLANVLLHQGRMAESLEQYDKLLALDPNFHRGRWNQGLARLLAGDFARGWQGYQFREQAEQVKLDKFAMPEWKGESLAGKSILVHAEQGVGDEIMFNTCLPDVIEQAREVHLTCDARLEKLFARSFPSVHVHSVVRGPTFRWQPPDGIDVYTHAGTLPLYLRGGWEKFPRQVRVLEADPELVELWRERYLELGPGPKIGISWRAGGHSSEQRRRTSLLDHWQPLFQLPGAQFVNLQYGDWRNDLEAARLRWGVTIHHWADSDPLTDLDGFAAQVAALDAVVSVGNTTIHMAGALGVPTWAVLPRVPGWRYLVSGDWMPWYKTVRLRRQTATGDWDEVYDRVAEELRSELATPSEPIKQSGSAVRRPVVSATPKPARVESKVAATGELPREKIGEAFVGALKQHRAGHLAEAARVYEQILALDPQHADSLHLSGVLFRQVGQTQLALVRLARAVELDPANSIYAYNYASSLRDAGQVDDAIAMLRRAVELNPHLAEAHLNLGTLLHARGKFADAVTAYEQALVARPDYAEAHHNIGSALRDQGKFDPAIECYRRALALRPDYADANLHLAGILREIGRPAEALTCFEHGIAHAPENAEAHVNHGMLLIQERRFAEGWNEWEWRWRQPNGPSARPFTQPLWNGEPLAGKSLLVHMEQGIGDEIMFATCLPDVIERAERVVVECAPRLMSLFARSYPRAAFVPREDWDRADWLAEAGPLDYQIPAGSLPRFLRRSLADFPHRSQWLSPEPHRVQRWWNALRELGAGLKVGIAWRGGFENMDGFKRSIPLDRLKPLAEVPGVRLINLQYGDHANEIAVATRDWSTPLTTLPNLNPRDDLDDLAALIRSLDVVISVSSATLHLAGALGAQTWALLSRAPSWRWFNGLSRAAWYQNVELIRQDRDGHWEPVIAEVTNRLNMLAAQRRASIPAPHLAHAASRANKH